MGRELRSTSTMRQDVTTTLRPPLPDLEAFYQLLPCQLTYRVCNNNNNNKHNGEVSKGICSMVKACLIWS